jgi:alpha-N-arabinofuranosidase
LRDAVVAALNFNIFHAHADRVRMTNIAQMVNVLQAMILTDKDRMLLTPTYYAYQMYVPFQGATTLPLSIRNNAQYKLGANAIPEVSASAARGQDGKLYLSLVNTNPAKAADVVIDVPGVSLKQLNGSVLTATDMDARNTFEKPLNVKPAALVVPAGAAGVTVKLPPKSVSVFAIE